ncbi:regulator of cell morphogenesis and NO signaling [Pasteurella langaaensis DSM 22999]|uniref:Regulator of cell morphogenesis and NO signaling n=1 Tax=Alitibacter langaaensis DSM 22999 TaxID=1122935 RepID=A0A2U0SQ89_9PAST|nr:iron-sulfur cluster repair protein YtfE [Pasteurella langaaensis]PVX33496.1 regulator of cell morphogenesis and NO signaling [Pasteurella langaaensis DSM 22999]
MSFANQKIGEIAVAVPGATKLFREYDLDFCCGGSVELATAAAKKEVDLAELEARLAQLQQTAEPEEKDWTQASYDDFTAYLVSRFHDGHRAQLPELIQLAETVERVHADRKDCPAGLSVELQAIFDELSQHMMKEEQILFPMIRAGNYAMACMPIRVMEMEHDQMGDQLETLKSITNNVTAPDDACSTWRTLYIGVGAFIEDLIQHTHLENNILFPRVRADA